MTAKGLMIYDIDISKPMQKISTINSALSALDDKQKVISGKMDYLLLRSRSITSFFFNIMKDSAALRVAEATLGIATTGVAIHRTMLQAAAATARGSFFEAAALQAIAVAMAANQARAVVLQVSMKLQEQRIEEMRRYTEAYDV